MAYDIREDKRLRRVHKTMKGIRMEPPVQRVYL